MSTFFLMTNGLLAAAALTVPVLLPRPDAPVLVMVAPAGGPAEAMRVVAAAGGVLLDGTRFGPLVIAAGDGPGFATRLYAAGAVLVTASPVRPGCSSSLPGTFR